MRVGLLETENFLPQYKTRKHAKECSGRQLGIHRSECAFINPALDVLRQWISDSHDRDKHFREFVPLERTEKKKPHEGRILLVPLQECSTDRFKKCGVVIRGRQLFHLFAANLATLAGLVLQNRAVQRLLTVEMAENDRFIHPSLIRKIAGCGSSKSLS